MNRKNKIKHPPFILPKCKRIIAIGDLHSDYNAMLMALKKGSVISGRNNKWSGGDTIVVQLGDQVDGGGRNIKIDEDNEIKIMTFLLDLHNQAVRKGGGVYSLIGNHELMNVMGDYRYVSKEGLKKFEGMKNRYQLFRPGGRMAKFFAQTRNVIIRVGDWIFVHGGISLPIAKKYNLKQINQMMRLYLLGNTKINRKVFNQLFNNNNSLLWCRTMSDTNYSHPNFYKILNILGAKGIVLGHTPQEQGINSICNGRIWRTDVAMSNAYGADSHNNIQVLEIINNGEKIRVLK